MTPINGFLLLIISMAILGGWGTILTSRMISAVNQTLTPAQQLGPGEGYVTRYQRLFELHRMEFPESSQRKQLVAIFLVQATIFVIAAIAFFRKVDQ